MNLAARMLDSMTYDGNRFFGAWKAALAVYFFTRAHDGAVVSDAGDTISFSRWYCFVCAVRQFFDRLLRDDIGER